MFPFIRWREQLIVKIIKTNLLQPGDIIVFQENGGRPIGHRIIRIEHQNGKRHFYTKGDRNSDEDRPVTEGMIIGKVIAIRKKNRLVECSSPEGSSLADTGPLFLTYGMFYLKNIMKNIITSIRIHRCRGTSQ